MHGKSESWPSVSSRNLIGGPGNQWKSRFLKSGPWEVNSMRESRSWPSFVSIPHWWTGDQSKLTYRNNRVFPSNFMRRVEISLSESERKSSDKFFPAVNNQRKSNLWKNRNARSLCVASSNGIVPWWNASPVSANTSTTFSLDPSLSNWEKQRNFYE